MVASLTNYAVELETEGTRSGKWAVRCLREQDWVGASKTYGWYGTQAEALAIATHLQACSW